MALRRNFRHLEWVLFLLILLLGGPVTRHPFAWGTLLLDAAGNL